VQLIDSLDGWDHRGGELAIGTYINFDLARFLDRGDGSGDWYPAATVSLQALAEPISGAIDRKICLNCGRASFKTSVLEIAWESHAKDKWRC